MATRTTDESAVPNRAHDSNAGGKAASAKRPRRTPAETDRKNAAKRSPSLKLTGKKRKAKIPTGLIKYRPNVEEALLAPLRDGKAVYIKVDDIRLPKKQRAYNTMLFICPLKVLGVDLPRLLVAMPPYGSDILDPRTDLKASVLARLGLSFSLASALAEALRKILWR